MYDLIDLIGRYCEFVTTKSVLVTAFDPAERALLRRALRRQGWEVRVAADGPDTMRALAQEIPAVWVVGDRRAESAAPALIRWVRGAPPAPEIPIVALIPNHHQELTVLCYRAGCDVVVATPLDL